MRVNHEIRARELRVISKTGEQLGVMALPQALALAEEQGLDLIEIVATSTPPVAKIMDFGKFRYDQTKREKENKKAQHQAKMKEVKLTPNIGEHDLDFKLRQARDFLDNGDKVKITITFRGREMSHPEIGTKLGERVIAILAENAMVETPAKMFGRQLGFVLSPIAKKKK